MDLIIETNLEKKIANADIPPKLKEQLMNEFYKNEEFHDAVKKEFAVRISQTEQLISAYRIVAKDLLKNL